MRDGLNNSTRENERAPENLKIEVPTGHMTRDDISNDLLVDFLWRERLKKTSSMLGAALLYAEKGWKIFLAPPGEKKSYKSAAYSGGERWGATRDPKQIVADFKNKKWRDANVGIPTGSTNDIFVVEADTMEGHGVDGIANLQKLQERYRPFPPTLMAISPSGSVHYYFQAPPKVPIKNSESEIAEGVDVRGEGGMVIALPSIKPGGGTYRWLNYLPIASAPIWLVTLTRMDRQPEPGPEPEPGLGLSLTNTASKTSCPRSVTDRDKGTSTRFYCGPQRHMSVYTTVIRMIARN
jgi:hypothetical protein